ncbi:hypothetical protein J6590_107571, partial [Homalodisca vitripennis]
MNMKANKKYDRNHPDCLELTEMRLRNIQRVIQEKYPERLWMLVAVEKCNEDGFNRTFSMDQSDESYGLDDSCPEEIFAG